MAARRTISWARYHRLVAWARARGTPPGYHELHHIVPRSAGGLDTSDNLVALTAREHFVAHWLLYRIYGTASAARAFLLMANNRQRQRSRDYAAARECMSIAMRGDANVARRPAVRAKLRANAVSPFAGKKRPAHAALLRQRGTFAGAANPMFGRGAEQVGSKNHRAKRVVGVHIWMGIGVWDTATSAAAELGVSLQAVSQAIRRGARARGWRLEYRP